MKILLVSYFYPPVGGGGVQRMKALSNYLIEREFTVGVYTEEVDRYKYDVFDDEVEIHPEINLYSGTSKVKKRVKVGAASNENTSVAKSEGSTGIKRLVKEIIKIPLPDTHIKYLLNGIKWSFKTQDKYEVVLGSVKPASNAVIAYFYSLFKRSSLVIEYRDLWFGQEFETTNSFYHFLRYLYEKAILSRAKLVVCASPAYVDKLIDRHPSVKNKIKVVTNGYDKSYLDAKEIDTIEMEQTNIKTIAHFGRFYGPRKIDELLVVLSEVKEGIRFVNYGPEIKNADINLDEFSFFEHRGYVSFNEAWKIQQSSEVDILILIEYTSDNIPGKIFEYIASGKPTIIVCPQTSVIRDEFSGLEGFYFIDNEELDMLPEIISQISKGSNHKREIDKYSRDNLNANYVKYIREFI